MPEQTVIQPPSQIAGFDPEVAPFLGIGLGLTGLALGLRPRLAPIPLALTALAAVFYRDPERVTPDRPDLLFAAADGVVLGIDELYEHRFLHTDAVRITTLLSPFDVPVNRSPTTGIVRYVAYAGAEAGTVRKGGSTVGGARTYIGIEARWGPLLVAQVAGPLSPRVVCRVEEGATIEAGARLGTVRFGSRLDMIVQRDSLEIMVHAGQRVVAGQTPVARVVPLA
jgi:phosphatidylserine decarboxylase